MRDQAESPRPVGPARESYAYFIQAEEGGPVKIGYAVDPLHRLSILQIGHPSKLVIRALIPGGQDVERRLHQAFAADRLRGEWFNPTPLMVKCGRVRLDDHKPTEPAETVDLLDIQRKVTHHKLADYGIRDRVSGEPIVTEADRAASYYPPFQ